MYNPHYSSKINFGELSSNSQSITQKWKDSEFLTIPDLQKNYIVHYIDKNNTDFRLALEFLKGVRTTAIGVESFKNEPCYIVFSGKKRAYIFKISKIGSNKNFLDFFKGFLENRKNLKIVFDIEKFSKTAEKILGKDLSENYQSVYEIKQNLFFSRTKRKDLNFCCQRIFGKKFLKFFFKR